MLPNCCFSGLQTQFTTGWVFYWKAFCVSAGLCLPTNYLADKVISNTWHLYWLLFTASVVDQISVLLFESYEKGKMMENYQLLSFIWCTKILSGLLKLFFPTGPETFVMCYRVFAGEVSTSQLGSGYQTCQVRSSTKFASTVFSHKDSCKIGQTTN